MSYATTGSPSPTLTPRTCHRGSPCCWYSLAWWGPWRGWLRLLVALLGVVLLIACRMDRTNLYWVCFHHHLLAYQYLQHREHPDQHSPGLHRSHPHPAGLHCLGWLRARTLHEVGKLGWNQKSLLLDNKLGLSRRMLLCMLRQIMKR